MKLSPQHIESQIGTTRYISQESLTSLRTLTLCVLDMKNGTKVVGQSACLDAATFDAEVGKKLARKDAVAKIWQLEGYLVASLTRLAPAGTVEYWPLTSRIETFPLPLALPNGEVLAIYRCVRVWRLLRIPPRLVRR